MDLHHKTVLITGASRGLGLQIAKHFWQLGAKLILVARSAHLLAALESSLAVTARPCQTLQTIVIDLSREDAVKKLIAKINLKKIDVLINNAATLGPMGPAWENDWAAWQSTLRVNLLTPIELCRAIIPSMLKRPGGKIINLSGGGATSVRPNFSAYAVAKTGLVRFSETIAAEANPYIQINCIAPGAMNTDMLAESIRWEKIPVGEKEPSLVAQTESTALTQAVELCAFLASSQSQGITGKLISARWDPWHSLPDHLAELSSTDIYTLRRIVPNDRGKNWSGPTT